MCLRVEGSDFAEIVLIQSRDAKMSFTKDVKKLFGKLTLKVLNNLCWTKSVVNREIFSNSDCYHICIWNKVMNSRRKNAGFKSNG